MSAAGAEAGMGPDPPLVTVIILCHNYGRFLAEAIDSALAQTYPNLEVMVVDDGSTDDTLEVAARYGDSIRLVTHENYGIERTCNDAVPRANGRYFAFLSADDVFEPTYVEELVRALAASPDASYAYCRARLFGSQTGLATCFPYSAYILVRRLNYINGCALTARDDFLALGGYAEELGEHGPEDWDFWLTMLEHGKRGTYVRKPLLRWRRHDAGSRNIETGSRLERAVALIRGRHTDLYARVSDARGTTAYTLDLAVAALDVAVGLSRWAAVTRALERASWRRYRRWHASRSEGR